MNYYNEIKNDDIRGRGTYRQVLNAVKSLVKYDFNPILCITNYYNEDEKTLVEEFKTVFKKIGFEAENNNFKINNAYKKGQITDTTTWNSTDCEYGRVLTAKGVYTCPFLANDHRGRSGGSFKDFSRKNPLETDFCSLCLKNKDALFKIDFNLFKE